MRSLLLVLTLSLSAAAPAQSSVAGRVLDAEGVAVPDAVVRWLPMPGQPGDVLSTKAGSDGRFDIAGASVPCMMLVRAPGRGMAIRRILDAAELVDLHMVRPASVRIRVVDGSGKAVEGCRVGIQWAYADERSAVVVPKTAPERALATTGPDGTCTLADLPMGARVVLGVQDERFAQLDYQTGFVVGDALEHKLVVQPGGVIEGRLQFAGRPLAGIQVGAQALKVPGWGDAITDAQGRFRLTQLPADTYNVFPMLERNEPGPWTVAAGVVALKEGEHRKQLILSAETGVLVVGRLIDGKDQPLAGRWVGMYGPAKPKTGAAVDSAVTDADGTFRFRTPPGEIYVYSMDAVGEGTEAGEFAQKTVQVSATNVPVIVLRLNKQVALTLEGVVRTEAGDPVPDADVQVVGDGGVEWTRSDEDGRYRFERVYLPSKVWAVSGSSATRSGVSVTGPRAYLALAKDQPVAFAVRVEDPAGRPIPGARLRIEQWNEHGSTNATFELVAGDDGLARYGRMFNDGAYFGRVRAPGFATAHLFPVQPSGIAAPPRVVRLEVANQFISGRVIDEKGRVVKGATVSVPDEEGVVATTDGQGRYRIGPVRAGRVTLLVNKDEVTTSWFVTAGRTDAELLLRDLRRGG